MKKAFLLAFSVLLIGCGKQSSPVGGAAPQTQTFGLASSADLNTNAQALPAIDFTEGNRFQSTEPVPVGVKVPIAGYEPPVLE